jgi:hypothetical protein
MGATALFSATPCPPDRRTGVGNIETNKPRLGAARQQRRTNPRNHHHGSTRPNRPATRPSSFSGIRDHHCVTTL